MRLFRLFLAVLFVIVSALYGYTAISTTLSGTSVPPVLKSDREILEVSVHAGEDVLLEGLTASDAQDGDLTGMIQISGISKLVSDNTAKVSYLVFDSDHNLAVLTRPVRYTDYTPPRFSISKALIYYRNESIQLLDRISATDVVDGDLTSSIRVSSLMPTSDPDIFQITCQVTNSLGDTVYLTLPIIQPDSFAVRPEISLSSHLIYLEKGDSFNPRHYLTGVTAPNGQGDVSSVVISNPVDTATAGTYYVHYTYPHETAPAVAILTVVVE